MKKIPRRKVGYVLTEDVAEALDRFHEERHQDKSWVVEIALREYLRGQGYWSELVDVVNAG